MDVEAELARILQEEINKEVLYAAKVASYQKSGWTLVTSAAPVEDIGGWMQANIRDEWRVFFESWLFKDADDAMLFRLTWG